MLVSMPAEEVDGQQPLWPRPAQDNDYHSEDRGRHG
jgi:hypothetical protein